MAGNCLIFPFSLFIQSRLDLYFIELSPLSVIHICGLLVRLGKHEEFISVHSSRIYTQKYKKLIYVRNIDCLLCFFFAFVGQYG